MPTTTLRRSAGWTSCAAGWDGYDQPPLDVVGCADHQALAAELARRSITLVRNDDRLLPLKPAADARIAVVQSMPADLTPADTSSTVPPTLAAALRRRHAGRRGDPPAGGARRGRHRGSRRAARSRSTSSSSGRSPRTSSRRRRRWPRRSWRPASRPSPSPCARRGTCSRTRPPEPTSAATASCRRRWRRWRPRCWARRRSPAGCPSTSPACIHAVTGSMAWG